MSVSKQWTNQMYLGEGQTYLHMNKRFECLFALCCSSAVATYNCFWTQERIFYEPLLRCGPIYSMFGKSSKPKSSHINRKIYA